MSDVYFYLFVRGDRQEDERKRKEKEERLAREEEFLRSSLRGSRKLQALEKSPPTTLRPPAAPQVTGVVNVAYTTHEEDEGVNGDDDLSGADGVDPGFANPGLGPSSQQLSAQQRHAEDHR